MVILWMINEVKELLADDEYATVITVANNIYRVPKDKFFQERRARLYRYFSAILQRDLDENTMNL